MVCIDGVQEPTLFAFFLFWLAFMFVIGIAVGWSIWGRKN